MSLQECDGMSELDGLGRSFEEHRGHLRQVAFRILGSWTEADDALHEAWLRLNRADSAEVDNLGGWLTTVVARLCLDMLRARSVRQPDLVGNEEEEVDPSTNPETEAALASSLGPALLIVLETLTPAERV